MLGKSEKRSFCGQPDHKGALLALKDSLIFETHFISLRGVSKLHFHALYASAIPLSEHFVTKLENVVGGIGDSYGWMKMNDFVSGIFSASHHVTAIISIVTKNCFIVSSVISH